MFQKVVLGAVILVGWIGVRVSQAAEPRDIDVQLSLTFEGQTLNFPRYRAPLKQTAWLVQRVGERLFTVEVTPNRVETAGPEQIHFEMEIASQIENGPREIHSKVQIVTLLGEPAFLSQGTEERETFSATVRAL